MSKSSEATVIQNFSVPHFSTFLLSFVPKTSLPIFFVLLLYCLLSLQRFRNTRNKSSMADAVSQASETQSTEIPTKSLSHFLWKAGLFTLVLVLLPVLPSLAPESLNQTLHARSWELLQLILVGIAISYGLFSKKNDESGKDHHDSKLDNAQSYLSRLFQASSFFEYESENQAEIDDNEVQTWSSQYYREEPVFVVTKETAPVEEDNNSEGYIQKPLLLPVRTLKQGVSDSEQNEVNPSADQFQSDSTKQRNVDENIVLRSPIPWRSQSGRMEMKGNGDKKSRLESKSFRANSSPFASFSLESQDKSGDGGAAADVWKTNSSFSCSPPPPAPPPPPVRPPSIKKPVLFKSNSQVIHNGAPYRDKALKQRVMSVPMDYEMETRPTRTNSGKLGISVGTFRSNESVEKKIHIDSTATKGRIHHNKDDEDSEEAEDDVYYYEGNSVNREAAADDSATTDAGPDVDRKADEFIAKFREQIRQQRIQSIRRSTAERS